MTDRREERDHERRQRRRERRKARKAAERRHDELKEAWRLRRVEGERHGEREEGRSGRGRGGRTG